MRYTLLIDGDILVYQLGFSVEKRLWTAYSKEYDFWIADAPRKKDLLHTLNDMEIPLEEVELVLTKDLQPWSFFLQNYKTWFHSIMMKFPPEETFIYLSGSHNFREKAWSEYKAHRNHDHRPFYYDRIRTFLVEQGASIVEDIEADDALGIKQGQLLNRGKNPVLITLDKDLDQIPGRHYNWNKRLEYDVTEDEGIRWFWKQMLVGDPSENIVGDQKIKGIGDKKADALMDGVPTAELGELVLDAYCSHFGAKGHEKFRMNGKLLYILRTQEDYKNALK